MTADQFATLCISHLIDPGIALEDPEVVAALKARDDAEVEELIRNNF